MRTNEATSSTSAAAMIDTVAGYLHCIFLVNNVSCHNVSWAVFYYVYTAWRCVF